MPPSRRVRRKGKIPRPANSWILFRNHMLKELQVTEPVEGKGKQKQRQTDLSGEISRMWRDADDSTRRHFRELARQAKEEHGKMYPNYKYVPQRKEGLGQGSKIGRNGRMSTGANGVVQEASPSSNVVYDFINLCPNSSLKSEVEDDDVVSDADFKEEEEEAQPLFSPSEQPILASTSHATTTNDNGIPFPQYRYNQYPPQNQQMMAYQNHWMPYFSFGPAAHTSGGMYYPNVRLPNFADSDIQIPENIDALPYGYAARSNTPQLPPTPPRFIQRSSSQTLHTLPTYAYPNPMYDSSRPSASYYAGRASNYNFNSALDLPEEPYNYAQAHVETHHPVKSSSTPEWQESSSQELAQPLRTKFSMYDPTQPSATQTSYDRDLEVSSLNYNYYNYNYTSGNNSDAADLTADCDCDDYYSSTLGSEHPAGDLDSTVLGSQHAFSGELTLSCSLDELEVPVTDEAQTQTEDITTMHTTLIPSEESSAEQEQEQEQAQAQVQAREILEQWLNFDFSVPLNFDILD